MSGERRAADLRTRISAIEESYEFFLAFAAQGVRDDRESPAGGQLRDFLAKMSAALTDLAPDVSSVVKQDGLRPSESWARFIDVLARDGTAALAAVELVRDRQAISSQLVDNLNASIHVRALLTDLFLLDELLGRDSGNR